MDVSQLLPYLLGGGAISALIAALRWGRQDARDSVDAASSNSDLALRLRDDVVTELDRVKADCAKVKADLAAMHIENARLVALCRSNGVDPNGATA